MLFHVQIDVDSFAEQQDDMEELLAEVEEINQVRFNQAREGRGGGERPEREA